MRGGIRKAKMSKISGSTKNGRHTGLCKTLPYRVKGPIKQIIGVKTCRTIDHGRSDEPGCGANWKKIARFEKLKKSQSVFFETA